MSTVEHPQEVLQQLPVTQTSSSRTTIAENTEESKTTTQPSSNEKSSFQDERKGDVIHPAPGGPPGVDESAILQGKKL